MLRIVPQIDPARHPDALYHGGILFENNTVESFHRSVAEATAVDGLTIRHNTFTPTETFGGITDVSTPSFILNSGRNIVIEENRFLGDTPLTIIAGTSSAVPTLRGNQRITFSP